MLVTDETDTKTVVLGGHLLLPGGGTALNTGLLASGAQFHSEITALTTASAFSMADMLAHEATGCVAVPEYMAKLNMWLPQKMAMKRVRCLQEPAEPGSDKMGGTLGVYLEEDTVSGRSRHRVEDFRELGFVELDKQVVADIQTYATFNELWKEGLVYLGHRTIALSREMVGTTLVV